MNKQYTRLTLEEREEISRGQACGETITSIATRIGRNKSTVSRELKRYTSKKKGYRASAAQYRANWQATCRRRGKLKLLANKALEQYVIDHILLGWSPTQIVRRLGIEYPEDITMRVSHETIYTYIFVLPRGELKKQLLAGLRQQRKYRRKRKDKSKETETRGKLADIVSIEERPKEVEDRTVPGHWEGDLILGGHKRSGLGTLVERTTRLTLLVPLKDKDALSVRRAFAQKMKQLPKQLKKTMTYDQGKEMCEHRLFTKDTKIQVYFAHPGCPWERGTNENTNGLIRQYFPKGTDFKKVSRKEITRVQDLLNGRPRKALNFQTPNEVFNKLLR